MPRAHRFEFPGSLVHVMARGLKGMDIFRDDEDRSLFLARFSFAGIFPGHQYAETAISHKGLFAILGNSEFVREAVRKNKHRIAAFL